MDVNFERIGLRIKMARKMRRLTQAKLAEKINVSAPYLSMVETAKSKISIVALIRMSQILDISVDELLLENSASRIYICNDHWNLLLEDCSCHEQKLLFEVLRAVKEILRLKK